jgi:hypothetical protein
MQITSNELDRMLRLMFDAGETWGVCYSTWFTPTEKTKEEWYQNALKDLVMENEDICKNCDPAESPQCKNCVGS